MAFAPANSQRPMLVLGANGQLGTELVEQLASLGPLVAACRAKADRLAVAGWKTVDVADVGALQALVRDVRPWVVVNAAAYTAVDAAETDGDAAAAVNERAPAILAAEVARLGAALVHYSTDYVFNGASARPWREDDPIEPLNVYGRTKAAGEAAIRFSGAPHLILRTSWLYGPAGHNFVKTMLRLAAERDEISVVDDQVGTPTSARLVAAATRHLLDQSAGKVDWFARRGGTLHVACAGETSWCGFARAIFDFAVELGLRGHRPRIRPVSSSAFPTPARRPRYSRLDTGKLARECGFHPPDWDQELRNQLSGVYAGGFS